MTAPAVPPEVQGARDREALALARAWGFRAEEPGSLADVIGRLERVAAVVADPYRDRTDPYADQHRIEARNLARRLAAIRDRGGPEAIPPAPAAPTSIEDSSMKISSAFPGAYLKAVDLQGRAARVTIAECAMEHFDEGDKPVLRFSGKDRGLVLNKTNAAVIVDAYGDETNNWRGRPLELYPDRVMFSGRMVDAIRVRIPAAPPVTQPAPPAPPAPPAHDPESWDGMSESDIPF